MTTAGGAAFAAAVRMVDRVHDDAAVMRALAQPTMTTGLAHRRVHVVGVRDGANRRVALTMNEALLARIQTNRHITLVATDDLRVGAGRARHGAALADLHLDVVDDRADRHGRQRHRVARLHVDLNTGHDLVAHRQTLRRQDVGQRAIGILDQRDEGGAVGIVLEALDLGGHIDLATLEVDEAIGLLVAATAEAHGDATGIVAAALRMLALGQRLDRLALVELAAVDDHQLPEAWRDRFE